MDDSYKGQGIGSTALDMVILLAKQFAKQSAFYETLTLQCSDYDDTGRFLGDVPYRLSYYLNHGFCLDQRTKTFMRHLDMGYFFSMMTPEKFEKFLEDYSGGAYSRVDLDLKSFQPYARDILSILQTKHLILDSFCDQRVQEIAESDSSKAAQCILDRLYYDTSLTDEEYQDSAGNSIYILHLPLKDWSQSLETREQSKVKTLGVHKFNPKEIEDILVAIFGIGNSVSSCFEQITTGIVKQQTIATVLAEADYNIDPTVNKKVKKRKRSALEACHRKSAKSELGMTANSDKNG